jgi:hypothetical protein
MSGSPTKKNTAAMYNGTTTASLKKGPVTGVPISIRLTGPQAMSLWIDPTKTENHFGNTPICGTQHRLKRAYSSTYLLTDDVVHDCQKCFRFSVCVIADQHRIEYVSINGE